MLRRLAALAMAAGAGIAALAAPPASAQSPSPAAASSASQQQIAGADVSHPQCPVFVGQPMLGLPGSVPFAVVGVNDGVATDTNPCLATELAWATAATGGRIGTRVSLYLNTADPGAASARWPRSDTLGDADPYGTCRAPDTGPACAFAYGYALAKEDLARVHAPAGTTWWLDVESANTWTGGHRANRAVLEGMTVALRAGGARPGLYANRSDWTAIVGRVPATSPLDRLPTWLAGATTPSGAAANCTHDPLTPHGRIELAQYLPVLGSVDLDVRCGPRSSTGDGSGR